MDNVIDKDMDNTYMKVEMKNDKLEILGTNVTPNDFLILVSYVIKDLSIKTGVTHKILIDSITSFFDTGAFDNLIDSNEELN